MKSPFADKYAIVAMGGVYPDAKNVDEYWQNIIHKHCSIKEVSKERLHRETFYRPDLKNSVNKQDKTYTEIAATIEKLEFNPRDFRIPPLVAKHMDLNQKAILLAAQEAISSGVLEGVDKERVSVFMGNTMLSEIHHDFHKRMTFDYFATNLENVSSFTEVIDPLKRAGIIAEVRENVLNGTFSVTEDSAPGVLPNIIASRICSVFDLHGHAFVIDAACASSLATIICGIQQLKLHEADAVICGGADMQARENGMILFSGINALSQYGSYPFDSRADGFVIGMGAGLIIIKRLDDAIAADDTILSVITGYGQMSDGKGKAIAAPNSDWQAKTIIKAYEMAGYSPDTVELMEAHGTSTQVGDASEVSALKKVYKHFDITKKQFCGLTSVKSNIGHLKSAAGIAGVVKTVQALHNKILPPVADFREENPTLNLKDSPFYVIDDAQPWPEKEHPRRAGVSAFGFGGADYHIAFEEYRKKDYSNLAIHQYEEAAQDFPQAYYSEHSSQLLFASGTDSSAVLTSIKKAISTLSQSINPQKDLYKLNLCADAKAPCRFACTFTTLNDLADTYELLKDSLLDKSKLQQLSIKGISYSENAPLSNEQLAFMFPGQGAQYPDMQLDLIAAYPPAQKILSFADALWEQKTGYTISSLLSSNQRGVEATTSLLKETENTHPALLTTGLATYEILKSMNVVPKSMIGHSAGEVIALSAAGAISKRDAINLMHERAKAFSQVSVTGAMAALPLDTETTEKYISRWDLTLTIANINAPNQTIVSGTESAIEKLLSNCTNEKIRATKLPVSKAFHSPLMKEAEKSFAQSIDALSMQTPLISVVANENSSYYDTSEDAVKRQLSTQICSSVNFVDSIKKLYNDGIRIFVETGANSILSSLASTILADKNDVTVLKSDTKKGRSLTAFHQMLCGLFSAGITVDLIEPSIMPIKSLENKSESRETDAKQTESKKREKIVYSGVSTGLPGSFKNSFRDDNFEQLFEGRNQIERLTDREMESLVDLRVSKLMKSEKGANFVLLDSLNQVIQLAGKVGKIDLLADYAIDEKEIRNMSSAIALAVAAGYEALRDAQIPLIREYTKTASGATLPERWALPQEMQKDTGIIFANGFPMIDPIIAEVSRHISFKLGSKLKEEIFDFYHDLIERVSDKESKKLLADWYALNHSRLSDTPTEEDLYTFNHHLMNQLASQANNRLAQYINAQGPNFQINAACSSTATAITLSQELINSGRVKRMIVIGADDAGTEHSLPYVGAGFLSTGACSNEGDLYEAALPFDKRRKGMIMGAGAVGFVVEAESSCLHRGVEPVCELVGSHVFNTAGHHSALDVPRYAEELASFMERMEKEHNFTRQDLAKDMLYMSHETYTPARGGCSESEAVSLRHVFGEAYRKIEVSNTKGMTGHTMGASIEDAAAAKSLQYGKIPPVVNHKVPDPALEGLNLSKGNAHSYTYALRMAAGFGSQGNYLLLKKRAHGNNRIVNPQRYNNWLQQVSGISNPELVIEGRRLVIKDSNPGTIIVQRPKISTEILKSSVAVAAQQKNQSDYKTPIAATQRTNEKALDSPIKVKPTTSKSQTVQTDRSNEVLAVIAEVTGYDKSMLELDMEIEADLGVDTVKQATILAMLGEQFGLNQEEGFRISEFPTIGHIVNLFNANASNESQQITTISEDKFTPTASAINVDVTNDVLSVIAEVTGYDESMLELDMEIEADLGVDTVKQATILAMLGEQFGFDQEEGFRISEFPTIGHIVTLFNGNTQNKKSVDSTPSQAETEPVKSALGIDATKAVLAVIAEVTGYDESMLELDMEIEADLGVDTVKQATILAMLGDQFGFDQEEGFRISEFPTIGHIVTLFSGNTPVTDTTSQKAIVEKEHSKTVATLQENAIEGVLLPPTKEVKRKDTPLQALSPEQIVVETICQHSDYVEEMLLPKFQLQADLLLSKEQIAEVIKDLTQKMGCDIVLDSDETIGSLIDKIRQNQRSFMPTIADEKIDIARQVLLLKDSPLAEENSILTDKRILVIGDSQEIVNVFSTAITAQEITSFVISSKESIENLCEQFATVVQNKKFDIIIDTTACSTKTLFQELDSKEISELISQKADSRFALTKHLLEQDNIPARIIVLTSIDGSFGLDTASTDLDPLYGLSIGFYKGLRKEWAKKTTLSIVDLSPTLISNDLDSCCEIITKELTCKGAGVEVAYNNGKRQILLVEDQGFHKDDVTQAVSITHDDTILAVGAGAGITSHVLTALMEEQPCNVIITGRTKLISNVSQLASLSEKELQHEKQRIKQELQQRGERVTPVKVEKEFSHITKSIEIYRTISQLRELGCAVLYESTDIRDLDRMQEVVKKAKKLLGPITGIIHGAGIEISRSMSEKSLEEFHLVHSIKSQGAWNLSFLCKGEPLKFVTAFSSISGRFGNAAQLDYSAGNEFLNYWARMYNKTSNTQAVSLIWSGWAETGMAHRNSFVNEHAEYMGLHLLDPAVASRAAVREILTHSGHTEVCLNNGLGAMQEEEMSNLHFTALPMVDSIRSSNGTITEAHRVFSVKRDALLNNHRIAGTPLMPGVGFMEMMAETYTLLEESDAPFIFRNVKFSEAFKLYRDQSRPVYLDITKASIENAWNMNLVAPFQSRLANDPTPISYAEAMVARAEPDLTDLHPDSWDYRNAISHQYNHIDSFVKHFSNNVELGAILDDCKREHTADKKVFTFNDTCFKRTLRFPIAQFSTKDYPVHEYLLNPAFLDTLHQAGAIFSIFSKSEVYLPYGAKEFGILKPMRDDEMYEVFVQRISEERETILYNIVLLNEAKEITAYIRESLFHRINQ